MGHAVVAHNLFIKGPAETKDDLQASLKTLFEEFELLEIKNNSFHDNQAAVGNALRTPRPASSGVSIELDVRAPLLSRSSARSRMSPTRRMTDDGGGRTDQGSW